MAQINKPNQYFNTVTYTGNGSTQSITGVNFQPDMVWIKSRSLSNGHTVWDNIRGVTNWLTPNNSNTEDTYSGGLTSFDSDGFSIGNGGDINTSSATQVAWNWLGANGTASNTDGSITSTVSANTTSGFSIVAWTGDGSISATVGHGLGTTPACIIAKERTGGDWWHVWHKGLSGASYNIFLNNTENERSAYSDGHIKNNGASTFGFDSSTSNVNAVNHSGITNIAYCFAEKKGFSKFGKFQAIGENSNVFVYTGFKPAFVLIKSLVTDTWSNWYMFDNKRDPDNLTELALYANLTTNEEGYGGANYSQIDMLSNGFKIRRDGNWGVGGAAQSSIYMAFAEQPLVGTNDIPATAK